MGRWVGVVGVQGWVDRGWLGSRGGWVGDVGVMGVQRLGKVGGGGGPGVGGVVWVQGVR